MGFRLIELTSLHATAAATDVVQFEKVRFTTELHDENVYRGNPRPELDHAWAELLSAMMVGVDRDTAVKVGMNMSTAATDLQGSYLAELDVFHQLHCLVSLTCALLEDAVPVCGLMRGRE